MMARIKRGQPKPKNDWSDDQRTCLHLLNSRYTFAEAHDTKDAVIARIFNHLFAAQLATSGFVNGMSAVVIKEDYRYGWTKYDPAQGRAKHYVNVIMKDTPIQLQRNADVLIRTEAVIRELDLLDEVTPKAGSGVVRDETDSHATASTSTHQNAVTTVEEAAGVTRTLTQTKRAKRKAAAPTPATPNEKTKSLIETPSKRQRTAIARSATAAESPHEDEQIADKQIEDEQIEDDTDGHSGNDLLGSNDEPRPFVSQKDREASAAIREQYGVKRVLGSLPAVMVDEHGDRTTATDEAMLDATELAISGAPHIGEEDPTSAIGDVEVCEHVRQLLLVTSLDIDHGIYDEEQARLRLFGGGNKEYVIKAAQIVYSPAEAATFIGTLRNGMMHEDPPFALWSLVQAIIKFLGENIDEIGKNRPAPGVETHPLYENHSRYKNWKPSGFPKRSDSAWP